MVSYIFVGVCASIATGFWTYAYGICPFKPRFYR